MRTNDWTIWSGKVDTVAHLHGIAARENNCRKVGTRVDLAYRDRYGAVSCPGAGITCAPMPWR